MIGYDHFKSQMETNIPPEELATLLEDINFDEMEQDIARFAEEPSVTQVLEVGVDLKNYNSQIASELREAEAASIDDYLNQVPKMLILHKEISECDQALESIEKMLDEFKGSLGQLSSDISSLQMQSQAITLRLTNRKALEENYGSFTREIALTPIFIQQVTNGPVGPEYVPILSELHRKLLFVQRPEVKSTKAYKEVVSPLDHLRMKASDNIRKWMISKINALRDTYSTEQISIQNSMLQCAFLFQFLKENSRDVEQAIKTYYIEIVSRIYLENFKQLVYRLLKNMSSISIEQETIVPQQQKSFLFFRTKTSTNDSTPFFSLGERSKLLNEISAPPQQFKDEKYPLEALWRSLYQILIDAVTNEHIFASQFFLDDNIAASIFSPTTKYLEQVMDDLFQRINEPVCISILLRFSMSFKNEMNHRKVFKIDQHLSSIITKLQNRFKAIIQNNINSIESCSPQTLIENKETAHHATAPTRRFADFASSLSHVLNDSIQSIIQPELSKVSNSMINLIERTSKLFLDPKNFNELSIVFRINNYFLILQTLPHSSTASESPLVNEYGHLLAAAQDLFIDTEIHIYFPEIFEAVTKAFPDINSMDGPICKDFNIDSLISTANKFKENHVSEMKKIGDNQIEKFGNFQNGSDILCNLAKRLALFWTKYERLCRDIMKGDPKINTFLTVQQFVTDIRPIVDILHKK